MLTHTLGGQEVRFCETSAGWGESGGKRRKESEGGKDKLERG